MVTGTVAANTAIGRLEASMLETATTSSITNSMKVLEPWSWLWPSGWMRLNIQARPKNRSSTMKRSRQRLRSRVVDGSARNCRHLMMMTRWMTRIAAVQTPAVTAPVQRLDRNPTVPISSRMTSEAERRFCGELPHHFVVEDRHGCRWSRSGGRARRARAAPRAAGVWPAASRSAWRPSRPSVTLTHTPPTPTTGKAR